MIAAIRSEMAEARDNGRCVNVGAARHSMRGQAIPRDGHAISFDNGLVEPDTANQQMRVHTGARWRDVIARADPLGFGPKVMQSNHDFGVAATFCVNAHGWPVQQGPMGSTVRSFEMVLPNGELVTCSRTQNAELFGMTMGGYGLTGVITRMDVDLAANQRLEPTFEEMPAEAFGARFIEALNCTFLPLVHVTANGGSQPQSGLAYPTPRAECGLSLRNAQTTGVRMKSSFRASGPMAALDASRHILVWLQKRTALYRPWRYVSEFTDYQGSPIYII